MLIAADLSQRLGLIDAAIKDRIRAILAQSRICPPRRRASGPRRALELMQMDKKVLARRRCAWCCWRN